MSSETRARILEAALDCFCEQGYAASVDDIARRAGVVKQTLYHHYGSKDSLFREALTGLVRELVVELEGRSGSVRKDLLRFAIVYQSRTMSHKGLALFRMLVLDGPRHPELTQAMGETWRTGGAELERLLQEAMDRGELRRDDPEFAASMLLSMLSGKQRDHCLLQPADIQDVPRARTEKIIDTFLRAYAPA